ncbi:MAG: CopG family transcriptional regulator [Giesbergeria sp.]
MNKISPIDAPKLRVPENEKVTINLGYVDLGHIDLLVAEGFYSNRTDFIRTAIRSQLAAQQDAVRQVVTRKSLVLGLQRFGRAELEAVQRAGEALDIRVLGLAVIEADVSAELASATIASVTVLGAFQAGAEVKTALRGRMLP